MAPGVSYLTFSFNQFDVIRVCPPQFIYAKSSHPQLIQELHVSFEPVVQVLDDGVLHVLKLLGFIPAAKKSAKKPGEHIRNRPDEDVERGPRVSVPGEIGYGDYLELEIQSFRKQRTEILQAWTKKEGHDSVFRAPTTKHVQFASESSHDGCRSLKMLREARASQRLHLIIYLEYLLYSVARAILVLVRFAESKVKDGTMQKSHFIIPPARVFYKWVRSLIDGEDSGPAIEKVDNM
jgi:hypothetical protein